MTYYIEGIAVVIPMPLHTNNTCWIGLNAYDRSIGKLYVTVTLIRAFNGNNLAK